MSHFWHLAAPAVYYRLYMQNWFNMTWLAAWQGTLVVSLTYVLCSRYSRLPAHIRSWLWRLCLVKCLFLQFGLPQQALPVLPEARCMLAQVLPVDFISALPNWFYVKYYLSAPLGLIWLVVAVFHLVCLAVNLYQTRQWMRQSIPISNEAIHTTLVGLARVSGLRREPKLLACDHIQSPLVTGVIRPAILVPLRTFAACSHHETGLVLAHEMAHIKRKDLLWNWLPTIARIFLWYIPPMHFALRELSTAQEAACDQLAIAATRSSPSGYGRLLLRLSTPKSLHAVHPELAPSLASDATRVLKQRLICLRPMPQSKIVVSMVVGMFVLVALPFRLATADYAVRTESQVRVRVRDPNGSAPGLLRAVVR